MRMYDIISKKRDGGELNEAEIEYVVSNFTFGLIPDYQMSAFLMAVYFNSMTKRELALFTKHMAQSGDMMDLSDIEGIKVDKHSTGGVGDKTTLIVAPIVAACGVKVAKMSGRGLGHTGGTIDKLEAIPGFKTELTRDEFFEQVNRIGLSVIGQSGNLAPSDKKIYALRDVTATVPSIPLIASSIMSKKLAAGSNCILLDVKVGSGAFMKTIDEAIALAQAMVEIGEENGRRTAALITNMDIPLGHCIGNITEVHEAAEVLGALKVSKELYPHDLHEVCVELSAHLLELAGKGDLVACREMAQDAIKSGTAFKKLCEMVSSQGGDTAYITNMKKLNSPSDIVCVNSPSKGYVKSIDAEKIGIAAMIAGAGRETKESVIDYSAGIMLYSKPGDEVIRGGTLAAIYCNDEKKAAEAEKMLLSAYSFSDVPPLKQPLILASVDITGVKKY